MGETRELTRLILNRSHEQRTHLYLAFIFDDACIYEYCRFNAKSLGIKFIICSTRYVMLFVRVSLIFLFLDSLFPPMNIYPQLKIHRRLTNTRLFEVGRSTRPLRQTSNTFRVSKFVSRTIGAACNNWCCCTTYILWCIRQRRNLWPGAASLVNRISTEIA